MTFEFEYPTVTVRWVGTIASLRVVTDWVDVAVPDVYGMHQRLRGGAPIAGWVVQEGGEMDLSDKRHHVRGGVTEWEAKLLSYRDMGLMWHEIAKVMEVTRGRVSQMKSTLTERGFLDDEGMLTQQGKDVLDGEVESDNDAAGDS